MKYKIAALANLTIGSMQILVALNLIFIVIPRMMELYEQFNTVFSMTSSYLAPTLNVLLGIINIFIGYKILITKDKLKEKYFTVSIAILAITFIIAGAAATLSVLTIINPIYNMASSIQ